MHSSHKIPQKLSAGSPLPDATHWEGHTLTPYPSERLQRLQPRRLWRLTFDLSLDVVLLLFVLNFHNFAAPETTEMF